MKRNYSFIKHLAEAEEKFITVNVADKNAARRDIERSARKTGSQLKSQEKADAKETQANAESEQNPQLKGLKMRRARMMDQLATINAQIGRIKKSTGGR